MSTLRRTCNVMNACNITQFGISRWVIRCRKEKHEVPGYVAGPQHFIRKIYQPIVFCFCLTINPFVPKTCIVLEYWWQLSINTWSCNFLCSFCSLWKRKSVKWMCKVTFLTLVYMCVYNDIWSFSWVH